MEPVQTTLKINHAKNVKEERKVERKKVMARSGEINMLLEEDFQAAVAVLIVIEKNEKVFNFVDNLWNEINFQLVEYS